MKRLLSALLCAALALSLTLSAAALSVEDTRKLLQEHYVDKIPEAVLSKPTTQAILAALDDPYTVYMTAEEYQNFLSSVNGPSLCGIGVSIQAVTDDELQIMSILANSPALEAGLEAGDRILAVDGVKLTSGINATDLIRGETGSTVTLTVRRLSDGQTKDYTLTRRPVTLPIVTYERVGDAGFINCTSFGESTVPTMEQAIRELDADVSAWLVDLRSNPGGSAEPASGAAGLFIGSNATMVYFLDGTRQKNSITTLSACPDLTDKPLIVLSSAYSASGSELFSAAVRDYGVGISVGQRSFGKGVAQDVFDETNTSGLFDGDCLKITTSRFYSPNGTTNQTVGVLPTLLLSADNTRAAALLLSAPAPEQAESCFKLTLAGQTLYISRSMALSDDYKAAFTELLEALPPSAVLSKGSGSKTWTTIAPATLAKELNLNYTTRTFPDVSNSIFATEIQTLAVYRLLSGYENGTFQPAASLTRAEFATIISSALNLSGGSASFTDVPKGAWFTPYVTAMAAKGFLAGDGNGAFRPDDPISCQEAVTVLSAVAAWCNMDAYDLTQEELSVNDWGEYSDYEPWAQIPARNLARLDALDDGLTPSALCTRAQAAGMLCKLMESIHLLWN